MTPQTYTVDWAIEAAKNPKTKFLFFWSDKGSLDHPSPAFFSQWFPSGFTHVGTRYPTSEHWMMAQKARLFGAEDIAAQILASDNPGRAKALGQQVLGFDQITWNSAAFGIVVQGCFQKFQQNQPLRDYILQTGDKILVEASPTDHIWGIGLSKDDPYASDPSNWNGTNLLGFALMQVRDHLREGTEP